VTPLSANLLLNYFIRIYHKQMKKSTCIICHF